MVPVLHVPAFEDNYIWLIHSSVSDNVAIVDPGDAAPVVQKLDSQGFTPVAILCTHHHGDHTGGNDQLRSRYGIPVYGPARESIPCITHKLHEGDRIVLDGLDLEFDILEIPGHTSGHIAYYGNEILFCGDTLFSAGCGRLFEGTAQQMHDSLGKLARLPDNTAVYCAHEYTLTNLRFALEVEPENTALRQRMSEVQKTRHNGSPSLPSTIGVEKRTNPFLRSAESSVRLAAEKRIGRKLKSTVEVFAEIRHWKDGFHG